MECYSSEWVSLVLKINFIIFRMQGINAIGRYWLISFLGIGTISTCRQLERTMEWNHINKKDSGLLGELSENEVWNYYWDDDEILSRPGEIIFFLWTILLHSINEMWSNRDSASRTRGDDEGIVGEWTRERSSSSGTYGGATLLIQNRSVFWSSGAESKGFSFLPHLFQRCLMINRTAEAFPRVFFHLFS